MINPDNTDLSLLNAQIEARQAGTKIPRRGETHRRYIVTNPPSDTVDTAGLAFVANGDAGTVKRSGDSVRVTAFPRTRQLLGKLGVQTKPIRS